jgi:hypothetical protein
MLLRRLVAAAVAAAVLSVLLPLAITLVVQGDATSPDEVPAAARAAGSPLVFALILLAVDFLLVRGRLSGAVSMLTWAGRHDAAAIVAVTGLRRPTDRAAARLWLADHPRHDPEAPEVARIRSHLQVLVGDLAGARSTTVALPRGTPADAAWAGVTEASTDLAAGQPFDARALRAAVEALPDGEERARLAAEVAALVAQGRFTCLGDHLAALDWARPLVGRRDAGVIVRGYWLPISVLVIVTALVLSFVFPITF